jgi:ATP-binding cassette subfamily B protein
VLILDEPTTGLDAVSERRVLSGLASLMRGRTTVVITHSLTLARSADLVAVMDEGRLVEVDAPDRLLTRGSRFRQLWVGRREDDDHIAAGGTA